LLAAGTSYSASFYVYEPATGHFTNFPSNDYLVYPAIWDSSGNKLYFLSYNDQPGKNHVTLLHQYSMSTNEHKITDLSTFFQTEYRENSLVAVISNGDQLVIQAEDATSTVLSAGLWLIEVQEQHVKEIASLRDLAIGLPDWYATEGLEIEYTQWNRKTDQILVAIGEGIPSHTVTVTSVDWKTNARTPLLDYRDLPASADKYQAGLPHYASYITPDGDFLFYFGETNYDNDRYRTPIYGLRLSTRSEPFFVTDVYNVDCLAKWLLLKIQGEHEIRRYIYPFYMLCPG
jgi:hypothetical protein